MPLISIYSTFSDLNAADRISSILLEEKLVACYNLFPVDSKYMWEGKLVHEKEIAVLYKSLDSYWIPIQKRLEHIHPYDVPIIAKYEIECNDAYLAWIKSCLD